ncbi:MAG: PleD family two-component system response regulator [Methylocella sp.]
MTARVLVVDDLAPNLKLLEARLSAEYFEVLTAANGADALQICANGDCDIVLLDVMMPGMDGLEVCRRLKGDKATAHIPVVLVTALNQPSDRRRGLDAGADDFLSKPIDEMALLARVRSLSRLRLVLDELRSRALRTAKLGIGDPFARATAGNGTGGRIMLVEDSPASAELISNALRKHHYIELERDRDKALDLGSAGNYDLFIVSLDLAEGEGLRFCARLRSREGTRPIPVLAVANPEDRKQILCGLDLGVNDYVLRPVDRSELAARARTQIRWKRYADCLRNNVEATIEMAAFDPLTGLKNRRCLETQLGVLLDPPRGGPLSAMILDLDGFKAINDRHGHDTGDRILKCFAARAKEIIRKTDLMCRLGGDEFVVVMPGTGLRGGLETAERIRAAIASDGFVVAAGGQPIAVTVSAGLAENAGDSSAALLRHADRALYRSKQDGRNRVSVDHAPD